MNLTNLYGGLGRLLLRSRGRLAGDTDEVLSDTDKREEFPDEAMARTRGAQGFSGHKDLGEISPEALLAIELGVVRGYSIQQVVRGVPADGFTGISSLVEETYPGRTLTIAHTVGMRTQNAASIGYYHEQGIGYMKAYDPGGDTRKGVECATGSDGLMCEERNGKIYTTIDANNLLSHPNCRLTWTPISLTQAQEMGLPDLPKRPLPDLPRRP